MTSYMEMVLGHEEPLWRFTSSTVTYTHMMLCFVIYGANILWAPVHTLIFYKIRSTCPINSTGASDAWPIDYSCGFRNNCRVCMYVSHTYYFELLCSECMRVTDHLCTSRQHTVGQEKSTETSDVVYRPCWWFYQTQLIYCMIDTREKLLTINDYYHYLVIWSWNNLFPLTGQQLSCSYLAKLSNQPVMSQCH